jgi:glutaredoxin 3
MQQKSRVEIFSAGCATCHAAVQLVQQLAGSTHEVVVHDMQQADVAYRAGSLGIRSVPAIVINGKLVEPSAKGGHDEASLRAAGLG